MAADQTQAEIPGPFTKLEIIYYNYWIMRDDRNEGRSEGLFFIPAKFREGRSGPFTLRRIIKSVLAFLIFLAFCLIIAFFARGTAPEIGNYGASKDEMRETNAAQQQYHLRLASQCISIKTSKACVQPCEIFAAGHSSKQVKTYCEIACNDGRGGQHPPSCKRLESLAP